MTEPRAEAISIKEVTPVPKIKEPPTTDEEAQAKADEELRAAKAKDMG